MASSATTDRRTTTAATAADLEAILLGTAQDVPRPRGLPDLPSGWQHARVVQRAADASPERREGLLAFGFGLLALLWAPLGVLAVIVGTERAFLLVSLVVALAVLAPRPTRLADALDALRARARGFVERQRTPSSTR